LIGRDGKLLGIGSLFSQLVVQGFGPVACNVFVPIGLLPPVLEDLIRDGRPRRAPRPWLGINADEAHGRVFITRITAGGPSEAAGLEAGDLVLTVQGKAVTGLADFYRKVWGLGHAGVEVPLSILRGTQIREVTVRSADRNSSPQIRPDKVL
jgi:S1-C subfamily serine protease